jgi:hypothetical protein
LVAPHQNLEGTRIEPAEEDTAALDPPEFGAAEIEPIEAHPGDREVGGRGAGEEFADTYAERRVRAVVEEE